MYLSHVLCVLKMYLTQPRLVLVVIIVFHAVLHRSTRPRPEVVVIRVSATADKLDTMINKVVIDFMYEIW